MSTLQVPRTFTQEFPIIVSGLAMPPPEATLKLKGATGIVAVVLFQAVFTYWPVLNTLFHTAPLGWDTWGLILAVSTALFLIVEAEKAITRKIIGTYT